MLQNKLRKLNTCLTWRTLAMVLIFSSCKKAVEINSPNDRIITSQAFGDDASATSTIIGLYSQMMSSSRGFTSGVISLYAGLSADELSNTTSNFYEDDFRNNDLNPDNPIVQSAFWAQPYQYIYSCNAIIEELSKSQKITDSVRTQLMGEVKFMRGFLYFYLTNFFGDVPLVLSTDYNTNARLARMSQTQIYQQVISDLKSAQDLLKPTYWTQGKARPNKWTATALLARVYLYNKDWTNAEAQATTIINSGSYSLITDVAKVFTLANNSEAIWTFLSASPLANNTFEAPLFIPTNTTVIPTYAIPQSLLNAFESGDARKNAWTSSNTVNVSGVPTAFYYPSKYKIRGGAGAGVTEATIVFRLAEQYLIRAEARAQLNNIPGSKSDLNLIRARATLPGSTASDQASLLSAIEHERQIELFAEWGYRWLDLKRTNRANPVLSLLKGSHWQSTDVLFPIPFNEIKYNSLLAQNAGY